MQSKMTPREQPCYCGYGKTIHYASHIKLRQRGRNSCRFSGCSRRDYKPKE